jgi:class 3 adenylate cyclase
MEDTPLVRRLTAIVAIDVVGLSTMSAHDEEQALGLLRERLGIAEASIAQRRGRVFKQTGDGLLAEFASPVEAVRAAAEIQQAMAQANEVATAERRLSLRIGVNLGDVVESGDDLMGDAVNVAVRLEALAPVGGICLSRAIQEQIIGKLPWTMTDLGDQQVKNIPRPIRAYSLSLDAAAPVRRSVSTRSRLAWAGTAAAILGLAVATGAFFVSRDSGVGRRAEPAGPAALQAVSATPQLAAEPSAPRPFLAAEVPFVTQQRRRQLEFYGRAEGAKALAISPRGVAGFVTRRVNDGTARRLALDDCNKAAQREPGPHRELDRCDLYALGNTVVWTFRTPPTLAPPYRPATQLSPAPGLDLGSAPLLTDKARQELVETYSKADPSRALVIGRRRMEFWMQGDTDADAMRRALQACGHGTGRVCAVLAVNGELAVRPPTRYRPVEVFTPQDVADAALHEAIERYLVADDWRAVAIGRNGKISIVSGRPSEAIAAGEALRDCARAGGTECAITAIGPFLVAPK